MASKFSLKIYNYVANKYPKALKVYSRYRTINKNNKNASNLKSKFYLLKLLNADKQSKDLYSVKVPKNTTPPYNSNFLKQNIDKIPEHKLINRASITDLVEKLKNYDIISFDIFDTCIFRPFEKPTDLFYVLENKFNIINFYDLRIKAEQVARKQNNGKEINIKDIYKQLSNYCLITEKDAQQEIDLEIEVCYANPYILEVYKKLKELNKTIIFTSDMYLPKKCISEILNRNGFTDYDQLFVSNEYGCYKTNGLFDIVKNKYNNKTIIHIGDNESADIEGAMSANIDSEYYLQCNEFGKHYRPELLGQTASLYKGILNNYLYNGTLDISLKSEFACIHAGPIVSGYAEWINEFMRNNHLDKILFLSRDMDIVYQAYNKHYNEYQNDYAYTSRIALQQLIIKDFPYEYFDNNIRIRCEKGYTIKQAFKELNLEVLLPYCKKYNLTETDYLTSSTIIDIEKCFFENIDKISKQYINNEKAAKEYFKAKLQGAKKICLADLGWRGSNIAYLKYLLVDKWKLCEEVKGVLLGSTAKRSSLNLVSSGLITSFLYSPLHNRDLLKDKDWNTEYVNILVLEAIFTSPEPSLLKYQLNPKTNKCELLFCEENPNKDIILEFHKGILQFVDEFERHRQPFRKYYKITAVDCYTSMINILNNYNYIAQVVGDIVDTPNELATLSKERTKYVSLTEKMIDLNVFNNQSQS